MSEEARLERARSGLVPVSDGWFVLNVRDAAWLSNEAFGRRVAFEATGPAVRGRPDLEGHMFEQIGINLAFLSPGKPSGLYHADSRQEDFLVLSGECIAIVEEEERRLRAWDFLHCPPGTRHVFVGVGNEPCAILMVGARTGERNVVYPRSEAALAHGAGVATETSSANDAYAPFPHWQPERPTKEALDLT
ncbi:MAG TPA: cupin domain-containing protein [Gaiellaceae bacterium]